MNKGAIGAVLLMGVAALLLFLSDNGVRTPMPVYDYSSSALTPPPTPEPLPPNMLVGTWECLPHVDPNDTTEECALGLATSEGHVALDLSNVDEYPENLAAGVGVELVGERRALPQTGWSKYPVVGIFRVENITML